MSTKPAKGTKKKKETPLMAQYNSIKAKYPDALLLFRVGDFYETFGEDAITAARVLGIVQTKRGNGSESETALAGFPHHSMDTYLPKLVKAGYRVAICDQLEDPKKTKKLVKRGVTELITPGVAAGDNILDNRSNNFLASIAFGKNIHGIAFMDISTGEFYYAHGSEAYLNKLLQGFRPSEIIYSKAYKKELNQLCQGEYYTYQLDEWVYDLDFAREKMLSHFNTQSLKGFGMEGSGFSPEGEEQSITAAGVILHYLNETQHGNLQHVTSIARLEEDKYVWLDRFSIRNLELVHPNSSNATTLLDIMDYTVSPMGARMLKKWLVLPLKDVAPIEARHELVSYCLEHSTWREELRDHIKQCGDLERLISKVPLGKLNPREVVQLRNALSLLEPIKSMLGATEHIELCKYADRINPCPVLHQKLQDSIQDEAPAVLAKGNVIKDGVDPELDDLRSIMRDGKQYILGIQQREMEATGISSLKIGFNNVFGYYLEVTNAHKSKVPEAWIRKQTLTNAERYITEELKAYEQKILGAEEKIQVLEERLYTQVIHFIADYIEAIQLNAHLLAELDCLRAFAQLADTHQYCRPEVNESLAIDIQQGRHPVIERQLPVGERYVPNDIYLDSESQQMIIITGPNMSGKSAVLRQTALITLMAQMGSFVPAESAKIGVVDKIFTRVGASDNLSAGESTFMVEMNETASILNNVSPRSLLILDEIGRGTSTFDGISIAWSIAEYLHNHPSAKAKTLFATHYHELNELADKYPRIHNYHVATKEAGQQVLFLRKLTQGGSKHSFGIHVARMAGMPQVLLERAQALLHELEQKTLNEGDHDASATMKQIPAQEYQLNIFDGGNPQGKAVCDELEVLDLNTMTPIEAMLKLGELQKKLRD